MNAVQPRSFEDGGHGGSSQEIDLNIAFDFIFNAADSSKVDKLTFKDVSETSLG